MHNPAAIARHYLAAWNERAPAARRVQVAQVFAADASDLDPLMQGAGIDGIDAMIGAAQLQFQDHRFVLRGTPGAQADWEAVGADLLQWVQRQAMGDGPASESTRLLDELMALPGIAEAARQPNLDRLALPFLPITLRKDGLELNLFTTITTLGTPHDVTVHELMLESFFPADAVCRAWFDQQAEHGGANKHQ